MSASRIVSLSGGMDSTTVLAVAVSTAESSDDVLAVTFTYGSKHNRYEMEAVKRIVSHYGVRHKHISLEEVFKHVQSDLLLSGGEIPEGHYEQSNMSRTVVPGRNIVFASILAGLAWSDKIKRRSNDTAFVYLGIHAGDHTIYPDCRPDFYYRMKEAVEYGTDRAVSLVAPFLYSNKTGILEKGFDLGVPYGLTRTCYKDQPVACGRCGACQERLEAFRNIGVEDPIEYEFRGVLPKIREV